MAQQMKILADSGAYSSTSIMMMYNAGLTCMIPYRIPHFKYDGYQVYTNKAVSGPFRGHGANQPRFAVESQLDMIAERLGIEPVAIRLHNINTPGTITPNQWKITSCGLEECIRTVVERSGFHGRKKRLGKNRERNQENFKHQKKGLQN